MKKPMKRRLIRTLILCLVGLAIGGALAAYEIMNDPRYETRSAESKVAGVKVGGAFSLTDQDGKTRTDKDFSDRLKIVYFGFTYCPAICPTELGKITRALKAVEGEDPAALQKLYPVFVTVDPERDTPAVLKDYLSLYHPSFTGLTGTPDQIESMKKAYRIYAAKVQDEGMTEYTMDHSSFIYLLAPDDTVLGIYRAADEADMIVADIKANLQNH